MCSSDLGAHLLIQVDGNDDQAVLETLERIARIVRVDPESMLIAQSSAQRERLWKARRSIRESITMESPVFLAEDCVVPRSKIPAFLTELKSYLETRGLRSVMFGHAGDGNVHIDVLKGGMEHETWKAGLPGLKREIYRRAIALGGTITGEHGIGFIRKDYLGLEIGRAHV